VRISAALLGALWLAAPAAAARRRPLPDAAELLNRALAAPSVPYAARERVQAFGPSGKAKAQSRFIQYQAPGRRRVESSARKSGPLSLLIVDDGRRRLTAWPKARRAWLGPVPSEDPAAEAARLMSLYDLSVSTGSRTAGKAVWRLDLRSKADGRLRRSLWIEKNGGLTVRREDYRPDGSLLRRERTSRLETPDFAPEAFAVKAPDGAEIDASTVPYSGAPGAKRELAFRLPAWLPDGFVLLELSGASASYTDGLTTFTLAERGAPQAAPYASVALKSGAGRYYRSGDAITLAWTAGGREYALHGDLPEADLARAADSIPGAP